MVEELARWKAALNQKATDLQEALKRVLEERGKARESLLNVYRYTGLAALIHLYYIGNSGTQTFDTLPTET